MAGTSLTDVISHSIRTATTPARKTSASSNHPPIPNINAATSCSNNHHILYPATRTLLPFIRDPTDLLHTQTPLPTLIITSSSSSSSPSPSPFFFFFISISARCRFSKTPRKKIMVRSESSAYIILLTRKPEERKKENGLLTVGYAVLINPFLLPFFLLLFIRPRGGFYLYYNM